MRVFALTIVLFIGLAAQAVGAAQPDSHFGIDYVFPFQQRFQSKFWPRQFASIKAQWVNFHIVNWIDTEPQPPRGGVHTYRWEKLDNCVRLWQERNFHIVMTVRLKSGWFSGPIKYAPDLAGFVGRMHFRHSDRLPKKKYRQDMQAWMAALVERYDGDGIDDMPGLRLPVYHYQIGNEFANPMFWTGTVKDYGLYLKLMSQAAKGACAKCQIISNGIRWNDAFEGDDKATKFEQRYSRLLKNLPSAEWRKAWQRVREMTEFTVAQAHTYDILDGGGNGPYWRASQGYMTWMKKELAKNNLRTTIWDLEARCEPQIAFPAHSNFQKETQIKKGQRILTALKWSWHPLHEKAKLWYREEQARLVAKVFVTRFAAGFEKVFMGMPDDWDTTTAKWIFPNPYLGFMTGKGEKWPAFYTLALLIDKLEGFTSVRKVSAPKNISLYRFSFPAPGKPVWVIWRNTLQRLTMTQKLPPERVVLKSLTGPVGSLGILQTKQKPTPRIIGRSGTPLTLDVTTTPQLLF